jgi:hypothetical protein
MPSTWTRKVAAPVAAIAAAALFAGGSQAAANTPALHQAASGGRLSVHTARTLANRLAAKQRRQRSLVFAEVGRATRRSSSRIDFSYRDRSTSDVLCTARIVVVQTGSSRSADIRGAACKGIASEYLRFEKLSRDLSHSVSDKAGKVQKSLRHYSKSLAKCDNVVVPKSRRKDVAMLIESGGVYAFYRPLRMRLGDYVQSLHDVNAGDPVLVRGVEAWDRTLVLIDALPAASADPCGAVRQWSANGFSSDSAPADFGQLKVLRSDMGTEGGKLDDGAKHLLEEGVVRHAATAFSPKGLLALVGGGQFLKNGLWG